MADFTTLRFQLNTGTQATPVWTTVPASGSGTGQELRFSDGSGNGAVASASWPFMNRPASTTLVNYLYVFTADTTSLGSIGSSTSTPTAFSNSNYHELRLDWDNTGTFASAPQISAYTTTAHGNITAGDNSLLGGNSTDSGSRSYLKANMFGRVSSAGAPAAAPTNTPVVTDGTTGTLSPTAGANWCTHYQDLAGQLDYLAFPSTPAATTADDIELMLALFTGPNMATGTYTDVLTLNYTYV